MSRFPPNNPPLGPELKYSVLPNVINFVTHGAAIVDVLTNVPSGDDSHNRTGHAISVQSLDLRFAIVRPIIENKTDASQNYIARVSVVYDNSPEAAVTPDVNDIFDQSHINTLCGYNLNNEFRFTILKDEFFTFGNSGYSYQVVASGEILQVPGLPPSCFTRHWHFDLDYVTRYTSGSALDVVQGEYYVVYQTSATTDVVSNHTAYIRFYDC